MNHLSPKEIIVNLTKSSKEAFDKIISDILDSLQETDPKDEEYAQLLANLKEVTETTPTQYGFTAVNLSQVLPVVGSILGISLILAFETSGTITSKALGFVTKNR